jgi:hypothetical protein
LGLVVLEHLHAVAPAREHQAIALHVSEEGRTSLADL